MPNPSLRSASYKIEGVVPVEQVVYLPFQGGINISKEIYQLPIAAYSDIQNMRPMRPGFKKRKGMAKLYATADGTNKVITLYQFSKGRQASIATFAQMEDGEVKLLGDNPPAIGSSTIGTTVHTSDDASAMKPASWTVMDDKLLYTDVTGAPVIYPGTQSSVSSFFVYKGSVAIPQIPLAGEDYSFPLRDGLAATYADVSSLSTLADYHAIFIRTDCMATALAFTMLAANTSAAVMQVHYWNGAWTEVVGLSDGTAVDGKTMSKDGTMTWNSVSDHKPHYMFGNAGYWLRLSLASGSLASPTTISAATYESGFTKICNTWDGLPIAASESYLYKAATTSYLTYPASTIELEAMLATDKLYVGTIDPAVGLYIDPGAVPNENAATMTAKYFNGSEFVTVGTSLEDGTAVGGKTLAKAGWVTFEHPSDEQSTMFQTSQWQIRWYEISFSASLTTDMTLYVEYMPWFDIADFGICHNLITWKNRVSYAWSELPGYVAITAKDMPTSLNGSDYFIKDIGDGRSNKVVAQAIFRNELVIWQEEKGVDGGCITLLEGYDPLRIGKLLISTRFGTFSQKSVCVVDEDVVTFNLQLQADGTFAKSPDVKTAAFFLSRYGFCMIDGRGGVTIVSDPAITPYFDQTDTRCIRRGYEDDHWIAIDSTYNVIRIGLVSGSTATVPNIFLVYDYKTGSFSHDKLAYPLSCHVEVEAESGQHQVLQIGGGVNDGMVYQLNTGTNDVSTAIDAYVVMEFDGQGHTLHLEELILRCKGECTVYTYADTELDKTITIS